MNDVHPEIQRLIEKAAELSIQIDALRKFLDAHREDEQLYHHLIVSPPPYFAFASDEPLEAFLDIVRILMEELGVQGIVVYHPWKNAEGEEDRHLWRDAKAENLEWDDVRKQLRYQPHMHIIGVAPYVDLSISEKVESETGWVIHRFKDDSGVSLGTNREMVAAVIWTLSQFGWVNERNDLSAWLVGPDTLNFETREGDISEILALVRETAVDVLGEGDDLS